VAALEELHRTLMPLRSLPGLECPRFFLFPVRGSFLREYSRYFPDFSFRITVSELA
jgi:hypothetical protein